MRKIIFPALLALCLWVPPATSQTTEFRNAVHAKVNFLDYGQLYNEEPRWSQGFEVGYYRNLAPFLNVGLPFKLGLAKLPEVKDNTVTTSLDLVFHLLNAAGKGPVQPYAFGGAGYFLEKSENGHVQFPMGVGLNIRLSRFASINLQGEFRKAQVEDRDNVQIGGGFVYLLHRSEPKVIVPKDTDQDGTPDLTDKCPSQPGPAATQGCPDTDGDGLADAEDACPEDAGRVETKGCPDYDNDGFADKDDECPTDAGALLGCPDQDGDGFADKNDPCPTVAGRLGGCPDTDFDGIADNEDGCPNEPGPASNKGCPLPLDTDADGLADSDDRCPTSPGPASNQGCPEIKQETKERLAYAMRAVQFETAKAQLKNQSFQVLDEVIEIMRQYPDYKLSISGHTDNVGSDERNLTLSEARAKACYDYLTFRGISAERLRFAGFGESRPIADNSTAQGRELNRRVEFELTLE